MARIYYDKDIDLSPVKDKTIGIIGFGNHGRAHALNLKDSGIKIKVGFYEGSGRWDKLADREIEVGLIPNVTRQSDIIMMLISDTSMPEVFTESVLPYLKPGKTLMFSHGFNIHYKQIVPPDNIDVSMVSPKAPGPILREAYVKGAGIPALVAVHQDISGKAMENALAYARALGCGKAGVVESTFKEETEMALFSEQAVVCGGATHLISSGFETLVEAGYGPESAYFECMHELKLIVDLMYKGGMEFMRYSISDTAEYGDYTRGPMVIDAHVKENMKKVLAGIRDGTFAREWLTEHNEGRTRFNKLRRENSEHPIETTGKELRGMMGFLKKQS